LDGDGITGVGSVEVDGFGLGQVDSLGNSMLITFNSLDSDADGTSNLNDLDSDNDNIFDTHENEIPDGDNDGIAGVNATVNIFGVIDSLGTSKVIDTDGDGIPNFMDTDSDNDLFSDIIECPNFGNCPDFDEDGLPDYLDADCSELSLPKIVILQNAEQFCEGETLNLKAINQNSTSFPVKYEWQDPTSIMVAEESSLADTFMLTTLLIEKTQEGWYHFQIKSLQGKCPTINDSIFISLSTVEERRPELSFAQDTICPNNTITLIANNPNLTPIAYEWYIKRDTILELLGQTAIPSFTPSQQFSERSTFQVAAIFENCPKIFSELKSIFVHDTTFLVAANNSSEGQLITCVGDEVTFSATTIPYASYRWFGPGIDTIYQQNFTIPIQMANAGNFYVIATIDNCYEKVSNPTIIQFSESEMPPQIAEITPVCLGSPFSLKIKNPAIATQYEWFNATDSQFIARTELPALSFAAAEQAHATGYYVSAKNDLCGMQSSEIMKISVIDTLIPKAVIYSTDTTLCMVDTFALVANSVQTHQGFWQTLDGGNFLEADTNQTIIEALTAGENRIIWTITHESCPNQSSDTLFLTKISPPTVIANAGSNQSVCLASEIALGATAVDTTIFASWENLEGRTILNNTNPNATVNLLPGLNQFAWQLSTEFCGVFSKDTVKIWVDTIPEAVATILTVDTTICLGSEITTLIAEAPSEEIIGSWQIPNKVDVLTKKDSTSILIKNLPDTTLIFTWQLSNGSCTNFDQDQVEITVLGTDSLDVITDEYELFFNDTLTEIDLLNNDKLPFDLGWTIEISEPFTGTVVDRGEGFIDYIPRKNFYGTDQLMYKICAEDCPVYCDSTQVDFVIDVMDKNNDCFVPNIITPNGDGYNDAFVVPCLETYPKNTIRIFNRWGDEVFAAAPYNNNWEGTYKFSPLPNGTYFYFITLTNDPLDQLNGYFTIYR
ncbi:MAG: gliding motility-associated C-terminal domain-containing protein, partial [Saprospiraceae bacterium]